MSVSLIFIKFWIDQSQMNVCTTDVDLCQKVVMNSLTCTGSNVANEQSLYEKELRSYHLQAYVLEERILDLLQGVQDNSFRKQLKELLESFLEKENILNRLYGSVSDGFKNDYSSIEKDRRLRISIARFRFQFDSLKLKLEGLLVSQN